MTTEQDHATPAAPAAVAAAAAVLENARAVAEAFRQERDLYAARLAELQERHDRLRNLCDRLNEANELLMKRNNQIDAMVDGLKRLLDGDTDIPVCAPSDTDIPVCAHPESHCACCDAPLVRKMYYAGDEGPFCLLCLGVRLEQQKKEATRAALAAGRDGQ